MDQAMGFSRNFIHKLQLVLLSEKWKPGDQLKMQQEQSNISCKLQDFWRKQENLIACILLFLDFESDHIALRSDTVRNNVGLHSTALVVVSFYIFLVFSPARVFSYSIELITILKYLRDYVWRKEKLWQRWLHQKFQYELLP